VSARKTAANRANARHSTGPRTAGGKARASRNAVRHGLSISVRADPELSADVAELARRIGAGEACHLVVAVAEAQVAVRRVRRIRREVLALMGDPATFAPAPCQGEHPSRQQSPEWAALPGR
jgi:hypothetical protein